MMRLKTLFWFLLLPIVFSSTVASIVPILQVSRLAQDADLVILGEITSITGSDPHVGSNDRRYLVQAVIRVIDTVKGTTNLSSIEVRPSNQIPIDMAASGLAIGEYRLFFLNSTNSGYVFTSPYYLSLPAAPGRKVNSSDIVTEVVGQLENVINSGSHRGAKLEAIHALSTVNTNAATNALKGIATNDDIVVRFSGATELLRRNEISSFNFVQGVLVKPDSMPQYLIHNANYAIRDGVKDPAAIPVLRSLLKHPSDETREAAAEALLHTGSSAAIPGLLTALNDSNNEVRFIGVLGLSEITQQRKERPTRGEFMNDQGRYLSYWSQWATTNGFPISQ
jgi:hypothetical protein